MTNINFLLIISIDCQEQSLWELIKWSQRKNLWSFINFSQLILCPSNTLHSYPSDFFCLIFASLQSWTNTWVIMALFLSLVSLFRNNSNNNINNNNNNNSLKLIHDIHDYFIQDVLFKWGLLNKDFPLNRPHDDSIFETHFLTFKDQ